MSAISSPLAPLSLPADRPLINPWFIAVTVTLATFMELLDTSIANVALPHIAGGLSVSQDESTWVLTSYLVSNAVVLPLSAWLSSVFGRKRFYMTCVGLFTISSTLCGLAPSLPWLIFFRVLQGIGGGGLAPSEQAILVDTFPAAKRAAAFAVYSLAIVAAPAVGPTLGGWITDNWSWRWVFFINIPVGILSLVLTWLIVPAGAGEVKQFRKAGSDQTKKASIDIIGILLVAIGFGCLEAVLDKGQEDDWFSSRFIIVFFTIAAVCLVCAFFWELYVDDPVVDLRLMKNRNFAIACGLYTVFGFALFGSTVLLPQLMQQLFGYTATDAGMVLSPGAVVVMCMAPMTPRLLRYIQPKWLVLCGLVLLALSLQYMTGFSLDLDYKTAAHARMFQGVGIGLLFVPVSQIAYSYLPREKNNQASSITNLFRNQGGSFGIAFVTTMLARRNQYHQSILGSHITPFSSSTSQTLSALQTQFINAGMSTSAALDRAQATLYETVQHQGAMLSFIDCFWLLSIVCIIGAVTCLAVKPTASTAKAPEGAH
jgi:DHA2 family multidrug resistance protein